MDTKENRKEENCRIKCKLINREVLKKCEKNGHMPVNSERVEKLNKTHLGRIQFPNGLLFETEEWKEREKTKDNYKNDRFCKT